MFPWYATKSLDVKYHFENCIFENVDVTVEANDIHSRLYAASKGLSNFIENTDYVESTKKTAKDTNFATGAITFLYTDTTTEEGDLGEDIQKSTFCLTTNHSKKC